MKLIISLLIVFAGFNATATSPYQVTNILSYEFGESVHLMHVPVGTYNKINIRIANNGLALVTKTQEGIQINPDNGDSFPTSSVIAQKVVPLSQLELDYLGRFYRNMYYSQVETFYAGIVCEILVSVEATIDDLYIYRDGQSVHVSSAQGCYMGRTVYPADQEMAEAAYEVKQYLRSLANEILYEDAM